MTCRPTTSTRRFWREPSSTVRSRFKESLLTPRSSCRKSRIPISTRSTFSVVTFLRRKHRPYKVSSGAFGRVHPKREFRDGAGGLGAFEVAFRFSRMNLDNKDVLGGGRLNDVTAVFNSLRHKELPGDDEHRPGQPLLGYRPPCANVADKTPSGVLGQELENPSTRALKQKQIPPFSFGTYGLSFQVLQTRDLFCMRRSVQGRTRRSCGTDEYFGVGFANIEVHHLDRELLSKKEKIHDAR